jgi:SSS family transporter
MIAAAADSAPVMTLTRVDFLVVGAALAILGLIAYLAGRKEKDTRDFFLGGRSVPPLVATLSFAAAEISALTVIGVPAVAYSENWHYLQFFVGSAAGRIFVAFLFIPVFYKHNCTTVFEFLRDRFGPETEYAGSAFFFITRLLGAGVRLYAACLGISLIMGWSLAQAVLVFTAASVALIGFGGIKAVVWTGAFEACVFFLAGALVGTWLLLHIDGGLAEVWRVAGAAGRLSVFDFRLDLGNATTFWAGTANAFFVSLAVFGADQELVQRLLTVRTRRASQKALVSTILAALPLLCCYLALGTLLFVFYQQRGQPALGKPDEILGYCVTHTLPAGLKGLVLAAIVMTSIDSPLSSLSTSFVTNLYRPLIHKSGSEKHYLWVSRAGIAGFGLILIALALACQSVEKALWLAFKIISITGGSTLGVFLLGILTKRRSNAANTVAMILSALTCAELAVLSQYNYIALGWSWLIVIGTLETLALAYLLGPAMESDAPRQAT